MLGVWENSNDLPLPYLVLVQATLALVRRVTLCVTRRVIPAFTYPRVVLQTSATVKAFAHMLAKYPYSLRVALHTM